MIFSSTYERFIRFFAHMSSFVIEIFNVCFFVLLAQFSCTALFSLDLYSLELYFHLVFLPRPSAFWGFYYIVMSFCLFPVFSDSLRLDGFIAKVPVST